MSETMTNANVETKKENEPINIGVETPLEFKTHTEGQITTTRNLTDIINQLFASVLNDYAGCRIYAYDGGNNAIPNSLPNALPKELTNNMFIGNLYVDLYFEKNHNNAGGIDNLELINKEGSSSVERLSRVCGGGPSRVYNLNKDTKEALQEFIPGYVKGMKNFNPMWYYRIVEEAIPVNTFSGQYKSILRVMALDVDTIVGKIYGTKIHPDDKDEPVKYDYHCLTIMRSMNRATINYMNSQNQNAVINNEFVIQILRNDRSIISAMQEAIGLAPNFGGSYVPYNRV